MADGDLGLSTGEYNFGEDRSEARHYWFGDVQILRRCSDAKSFFGRIFRRVVHFCQAGADQPFCFVVENGQRASRRKRVNGGHAQSRTKVIELPNKLDIDVHIGEAKSRKTDKQF
jgi:hypothetical protein